MKHKRKPKGSVFAALDIGSSKVACFIARVTDDEGNYEVLGVGHQASVGVKSGVITDLNAAEIVIRQTVHAAENMAAQTMKGYPLREVIVNVPGVHAKSHRFDVDVQIAGQDITDNDVNRALSKGQEKSAEDEYELIHTIPTSFAIDGHSGIREPRGMFGQDLTVNIHLLTGEVSALRNMALCIERSHLDIQALCVSSYAAGLSSLVEDEMDLGCTVIDVGGGVTSIASFQGGNLIYCDALPVGGQHITSDIARGLTTSLTDAERIKTLYGSAVATATDEVEMIDIPQIGEREDSKGSAQINHVPRSLLVGIMQPRLEEIFEMVRAKLDDSGVSSIVGRRVVLTGGSSQIHGLRDFSQLVLDKKVRLGTPLHLHGIADAVSGPAFSTTAGLLTYVMEHSHEIPAEILSQVEPGNLWERIKIWMQENW